MTAIEKFDKAVSAYLRNKRLLGLSPVTLDNYAASLATFRGNWIAAHAGKPETDPAYADVLNFRDSMLDGGNSESTVKQRLVDLRAFSRHLSGPCWCLDFPTRKTRWSRHSLPTRKNAARATGQKED